MCLLDGLPIMYFGPMRDFLFLMRNYIFKILDAEFYILGTKFQILFFLNTNCYFYRRKITF